MLRLSKHPKTAHAASASCLVLILGSLGSCGTGEPAPGSSSPARPDPSTPSASAATTPAATTEPEGFPTAAFSGLGDEPVPAELAAELQEVLDTSADGHGTTATLITPEGTWSGATGKAAGDRPMTPDAQMSIASITKTFVAAQVMLLVEAGELDLDDLASDLLPPGLEFDTNGATIGNLLSMRSGLSESLIDEGDVERVKTEPLHVWTIEEVLATVAPEHGPVGQDWEYRGVNYMLLGSIIEQVTGASIADVLRRGVLVGEGYERLVSQPDERPTDPIALPFGARDHAFEDNGGYLPSLAGVTAFQFEGGMASDSSSLARWWRGLCSGQVVSPTSWEAMANFVERPGYGLGIMDRSSEYPGRPGVLGHTGSFNGYTTVALCFPDPGAVVTVLVNDEHDVDTLAGALVDAASS